MSQMDNANPVVLSATDLPTRRGRTATTSKSGDTGLKAAINTFPSYAADPFSLAESSSDSEVEEEDSASDPVDAQEIYGRFRSLFYVTFRRHFQNIPCHRIDACNLGCTYIHSRNLPYHVSANKKA